MREKNEGKGNYEAFFLNFLFEFIIFMWFNCCSLFGGFIAFSTVLIDCV